MPPCVSFAIRKNQKGEIAVGRKSLENQAIHILSGKMAIGISRHLAKKELRAELGDDYTFETTVPTIHSYSTRTGYQQTALEFVHWCENVRGIHKYARLESCEALVKEYLQYRVDNGCAIPTLKKDRSALGKLFGAPVDFPLPERKSENIKRGRGKKAMDKHFSEKKNSDVVRIAKATGSRREDAGKLSVDSFREIGGRLYVDFHKSKGGRNRIAPVRPDMEDTVRDLLTKAKAEGRDLLFDKIPSKMDVHSYRREYAQELYKIISHDRALRDEMLRQYPPRREIVKAEYYTIRGRAVSRTFLRDDLYLISQALGHNRLDVAVTHYLI